MNRRLSIATFLVSAVIGHVGIAGAEIRYTGSQYRDPFVGDMPVSKKDDQAILMKGRIININVQGVLFRANKPQAIIDGKIYSVGDKIAGIGKLSSIEKNGVRLMSEDGSIFFVPQIKRKPVNDDKPN